MSEHQSNVRDGDQRTVRYVRESQLIPDIVPFSSATLWRKVKAGTFPRPVKLAPRITAWNLRDVREWLEAQA